MKNTTTIPGGFRRTARSLALASATLPTLSLALPASEPVGPEFTANPQTANSQIKPAIAMDDDGDFVVIWEGGDPVLHNLSYYGVYAQRYNAAGERQGPQVQLSGASNISRETGPAVAMDAGGDFVAAWMQNDSDSYGIFAQRYNAAGVAQGSAFRVNTTQTGHQYTPRVAMDASGDFVVTWQSFSSDNGYYDLYAQRYNAAGVAQGGEFRVSATYNVFLDSHYSVAMDSDGDFVVAWPGNDHVNGMYGAVIRRYNAGGVPQSGEVLVASASAEATRVAMDAGGGFVVAWDDLDVSNREIYARRYDAGGMALGPQFQVNTTTASNQSLAAVAMGDDGGFVITWQSFVPSQTLFSVDTFAQRYDADGVVQGSEFQLDQTTDINFPQSKPAVAMDKDGDFVITWEGTGLSEIDRGIFARRYAHAVDLSVKQTESVDPVVQGSSLTYSITVTNPAASPGDATAIQLTDILPSTVAYNGFSADPEWSCAHGSGVVSCDYGIPLLPGDTQTVDITVDVPAGTGRINNQVSASAIDPDPVPTNDADGENTQVCNLSATDTIGFIAGSSGKLENAGNAPISLTRSGGACGAATVDYSTADGTATAGTDYTAINGTLSWAAGEQGKKTFQVPLSNDALVEANEIVLISLSGSSAAINPGQHVLSIKNDDSEPGGTITMASPDQSISENGGIAIFTAVLSQARTTDLTVPLIITGTGKRGVDYSLTGLVILAGQLSGDITITGLDDAVDEEDEFVTVTLGSIPGLTPGASITNTAVLADDEAAPIVGFANAADSIPEAKGKGGRVRLSTLSDKDVTVSISRSGGTAATDSSDYSLTTSLVIPVGKLEGFALAIANDAVAEPDETVVLTIGSALNGTPTGIASHVHTIRNDD